MSRNETNNDNPEATTVRMNFRLDTSNFPPLAHDTNCDCGFCIEAPSELPKMMYMPFDVFYNSENTVSNLDSTTGVEVQVVEQTPIDVLAVDHDEIENLLNKERSDNSERKQICFCGHSNNAHRYSDALDSEFCDFAKTYCPCRKFVAAFLVQDLRCFMWRTRGAGNLHALSLGLHQHSTKGLTVTPLFTPQCAVCHDAANPIKPVAINRYGKISAQPESKNTYLCVNCMRSIGGPGLRGI